MTEPPIMPEMLAALKKEIAMARSLSGGPAGTEPAYCYLCDPPGQSVIEAYLQEQQPTEPPEDQALPLFHVELPRLSPQHPALIDVLSRALGLPTTGQWKNSYLSEERLAEHLRRRQVELVILANAHQLLNRPNGVAWLVMYFRQHLNHIPLLLVGEGQQMDELLLWKATAWVVRRFHRVRLPGSPEVQESAESRAALHQFLGIQDDVHFPEK